MPYLIGTDLHGQKKNPENGQPSNLSHSFYSRGVFFPAFESNFPESACESGTSGRVLKSLIDSMIN